MDMRGIPTSACLCGGRAFYIVAWFNEDDYTVQGYETTALCATCGTLVTACTEIDHPSYQEA
jgi:hypothetical protein